MNPDSLHTIAHYINQHPLAVLSTVDEAGQPHGAALYAGSDDHLNVYFMTKTETTKARNIRSNPAVALTFASEEHQTTLQITGTATAVKAHDENATAFRVLAALKHEGEDYRLPLTKLTAGPYIVFKVNIERAVLTEYEHRDQLEGVIRTEYTNAD